MRDWPPIAEPELLQRLALDDEQFAAFFQDLIAAWPRREFDPAAFEHALGYPWERPAGSYVLAGEDVQQRRRPAGVGAVVERERDARPRRPHAHHGAQERRERRRARPPGDPGRQRAPHTAHTPKRNEPASRPSLKPSRRT